LGEFENAVREIKLACTLDESDPRQLLHALCALQKKGNAVEQRQYYSTRSKETQQPLGRFEFAYILEEEKHYADSFREYQVAKRLAASVNGLNYIDARGGVYGADIVRAQVDNAIERVAKLNETSNETYSPRSEMKQRFCLYC